MTGIINIRWNAAWICVLLGLLGLMSGEANAAKTMGYTSTLLSDGRYLIVGGETEQGALSQVSIYDATSQQSTIQGVTLRASRKNHSATVLPNGTVLILGGLGQDGYPVATAELIDLDSQKTQLISNSGLIARSQHRATLLTDGKVLITGGLSATGLVISKAELWNPKTQQTETMNASLQTARYNHIAQLQPDSPVYIEGGQDATGKTLSMNELYDVHGQRFGYASGTQTLNSQALPSVAEIIPPADGFDINVDGWIVVRFNKPLKVETLNSSTVNLLGPNGLVAVKVVPAEAGMLLFVTPAQVLQPEGKYTLFINGATDVAGQPLSFTASSFKTASLNGANADGSLNASLILSDKPGQSGVDSVSSVTNQASATDSAVSNTVMQDDEDWTPTAQNYKGEWKSGRALLSKMYPPRHVELLRAYLREELERDGRLTYTQLEAKLPPIITPVVPARVTALVGQVLKLNGRPLSGVTLSLGNQSVVSDSNGEFVLSNIQAGLNQVLVIEGGSANSAYSKYGRYYHRLHIEPGKVNALRQPVWMTKLDTKYAIKISSPTKQEVVITNPKLPSFEVRIPAGVVIRDPAGKVVTEVSLTPVPADQTPFVMPYGEVPVYYTLQPGGAVIQSVNGKPQAATLIYPNYSTQPHGARFELFDYDPYGRGWYIYTTATVSEDGKRIVGDKPFQLYQFTASSAASSGGTPPVKGPKNCSDCTCSHSSGGSDLDPVSCHDGLFIEAGTDLRINDVLPIDITRTYRNEDANQRSFGVGAAQKYDLYLYFVNNTAYTSTEIDLILPNGGRIPFTPASSYISYTSTSAVYQSMVPGRFYKARLNISNDGHGNDFYITLNDGTTYAFSYYNSRLKWMRDRYGNRTAITRDSSNRISRITSPNGRYIDLVYAAATCTSCVTTATDSTGRYTSYTYDSYGHLMTATNSENGITSYTYDNSTHRMIAVNDPRNNSGEVTQPKVSNTYYTSTDGPNLDGRVKSQTFADLTTGSLTYAFDVNGNNIQTEVTHERGDVRRIEYNTDGFITRETLALGTPEQQVTTNVWDPVTKLLTSTTDALNRTTAYTYDSMGNQKTVTRMQGTSEAATWRFDYESTYNQVILSTDPLGRQVKYTYDSYGNLTEIKNLGNNTHTTMTYTVDGRLESQTSYTGTKALITRYAYEGGDLVTVANPLNQSVQYFTDSLGRVVAVTDPLHNVSFIEYDNLDRVRKTINPLSYVTEYTYDVNGNLKTLKDPSAHITSYTYDARNRLKTDTNPLGKVESYDYDNAGNLIRITDRKGQVTGKVYDYLSRVNQTGFGASTAAPASYARTVDYQYDSGNRVTQTKDSVSGTIQASYDGYDRLTREISGTGQVDYTYYTNGLIKTKTVLGQPSVSYSYDNGNRPVQILQGSDIVSFNYDEANRRTSYTLPNGVTQTYTFDDASQIVKIDYNKGPSVIGDLTYAYDAAGRRIQMGGSLAKSGLPQEMTANYDIANRLVQFNSRNFSYDDNGNLLNDGLRSYTWDAADRLVQIAGSTTTSFEYDPFNRRTSRVVNGSQKGYLYDGINVVQELSGAYPRANLLTGGIDGIFLRKSFDVADNYVTDALGSTLALTDAAGNAITKYEYDAYGNTTSSGTNSDNPYQYTGRENDGTGLYYYRARYYDPELSRFVSSDPIGFAGGINQYTYVNGNPVSYTDPTGEFAQIIAGGVIGGLAGLVGALNDPCATGLGIAKAVAVGAAVGAASAAVPVGGALAGAVIRNALAGFSGNSAGQIVTGGVGNYSPGQAVAQGVVGGLSGGYGNALGLTTGLNMARIGATSATAISTSLGVGTTGAIGMGAGLNMMLPSGLGGLNSAGSNGNACGCK